MKLIYRAFFLCLLPVFVHAQTFVAFTPCITTGLGNLAQKFSPTIEIGRQWDVFSTALALGKTGCGQTTGRDTSFYMELRPNLNVFQVGKFVNTFTPGIGYVFGASQNMMVEFTSGIEYSYTNNLHVNIMFGQYYFSGVTSSSSTAFFGVSIAKFFSPTHPKPLIQQQ